MSPSTDLIDFEAIETQKENIQSLPGGRSAKQLSVLCSPLSAKVPAALSETQTLRTTARAEFESELTSIDEADDPLDLFDRYVKWCSSAYPTGSKDSGLAPLLERATKTFLGNSLYKNDPRYLKLWLLYIHLFADSPRETYAFLAQHGVGEQLALFYEEYAAWLEQQNRWAQAEEVFAAGVDKGANPQGRLVKKYGEFQHRREAKGQNNDGPASPALPKVRPALVAKTDPYATSAELDQDPQARHREAAAMGAASKPKTGKKMAIFADADEAPAKTAAGQAWDSIGSVAERKKENKHDPKPWVGEKLDGGRKLVSGSSGQKMMIFRDPSLQNLNDNDLSPNTLQNSLKRTVTINPKTGKAECVFADLESVYPNGADANNEEYSFEELRAKQRGWLQKDWSKTSLPKNTKAVEHELTCHLDLPSTATLVDQENIMSSQDIKPMQTVPLKDSSNTAKQKRKEDKANRTRKIKVLETRTETQTIQLNMDSPARPKVRRKKPAEATMTIHTKEAMNDVYDMFNQTLSNPTKDTSAEETQNLDDDDDMDDYDDEDDEDDDDDDDMTSVGESTGTGRISNNASEFDETETGDFTESSIGRTGTDTEFSTHQTIDDNTGQIDDEYESGADDESLSLVHIDQGALVPSMDEEVRPTFETEGGITPTSPEARSFFSQDSENACMPHRVGKGVSSKLPFMTPIVEKTESSLGALTVRTESKTANLKTPSRENYVRSMGSISEGDLNSSPFEEDTEHYTTSQEDIKIAPPALPQPTRSTGPVSLSKKASIENKQTQPDDGVVKNSKSNASIKDVQVPIKGPIITDAQVNPLDETIRQTILSHIHPPLSSFPGYFDHTPALANKAGEIRKFIKSSSSKGSRSNIDSLPPPPLLTFPSSSRTYTLRKELGRGAFAPVYLVDNESSSSSSSSSSNPPQDASRHALEVIKCEDPPTPWEFFILSQAHRRLGLSRAASSIIKPYEMHLFADEGYLVEEYRAQGTLLDAINAARTARTSSAAGDGGTGLGLDEQLAMWLGVELLRTVEALHARGIVHGDVKPDNVALRLDGMDDASAALAWSSAFCPEGRDGWAAKGVVLIDFGRGADMRCFGARTQFVAEWRTSEADCAEMREMRPWTYQVDYHGIAGTVHSMLFGKYMEVVKADGARGLPGIAGRKYVIREGLKRYWQTEIWHEFFEVMLNSAAHVDGEEGQKLPLVNGMKRVRGLMEAWLVSQCERGVGLKGLIRRMELGLRERTK